MMSISPVCEAIGLSGDWQAQTTCTHYQLLHPPSGTLAANLNNPDLDPDPDQLLTVILILNLT